MALKFVKRRSPAGPHRGHPGRGGLPPFREGAGSWRWIFSVMVEGAQGEEGRLVSESE
jgi:hypothetical protein